MVGSNYVKRAQHSADKGEKLFAGACSPPREGTKEQLSINPLNHSSETLTRKICDRSVTCGKQLNPGHNCFFLREPHLSSTSGCPYQNDVSQLFGSCTCFQEDGKSRPPVMYPSGLRKASNH